MSLGPNQVLGNLLSDAVDPHSWRTKKMLCEEDEAETEASGVPKCAVLIYHLVAHLESPMWPTQAYGSGDGVSSGGWGGGSYCESVSYRYSGVVWRAGRSVVHLSSYNSLQAYAAALVQNAAQHVGFAEAFATAGGLKRLRKLLDSSHSVVVRFASGALKNITDSYDHRPSSSEAENEAAEAGVRSTFRRLSLLHRPGKQAKRRMPALLGDKGVQAAVRARSSEDARDKNLEAEAATTLQVKIKPAPAPSFSPHLPARASGELSRGAGAAAREPHGTGSRSGGGPHGGSAPVAVGLARASPRCRGATPSRRTPAAALASFIAPASSPCSMHLPVARCHCAGAITKRAARQHRAHDVITAAVRCGRGAGALARPRGAAQRSAAEATRRALCH